LLNLGHSLHYHGASFSTIVMLTERECFDAPVPQSMWHSLLFFDRHAACLGMIDNQFPQVSRIIVWIVWSFESGASTGAENIVVSLFFFGFRRAETTFIFSSAFLDVSHCCHKFCRAYGEVGGQGGQVERSNILQLNNDFWRRRSCASTRAVMVNEGMGKETAPP